MHRVCFTEQRLQRRLLEKLKKKKKDRENLAYIRRKRNEEDKTELITKVENYSNEYTDK